MLVTHATILTEAVEFHIDSNGNFTAYTGGEQLAQADSLKRVKRLARFELKKKQVRVAVPFTMIDHVSQKLTPAIAKGRHASRRNSILIWIDDGTENGRSDTLELWGYRASRQLQGNLSAKSLKRINYLFEQKRLTEQRLDKIAALITTWQEEHTIDLGQVLDAALAAAAESMEDTDDEPEIDELDPPVSDEPDNPMELRIS